MSGIPGDNAERTLNKTFFSILYLRNLNIELNLKSDNLLERIAIIIYIGEKK